MISQHQISAGISSTIYSKDEIIISLQTKLRSKDDDLSSKNDHITTLEESIAMLEEKIVTMSLELASSKGKMSIVCQNSKRMIHFSRRCHPPKRCVSRSWSEGILQVTAQLV